MKIKAMKTQIFLRRLTYPKRIAQFLSSICVLLVSFLATPSVLALDLTWDPGNTNNGAIIDPGNGSWDLDTTTNFNWNNGTTNVSWTQTSTTVTPYNAVFGGADGTNYIVTLDQGSQMAVSNLIINSSGYVFTNNDGISSLGQQSGASIIVADGKSVDFYNNFSSSGGGASGNIYVGNGSTLRLEGNYLNNQVRLLTPTNGAGGVIVLSGTGGNFVPFILATVIVTNGAILTPAANQSVWIGDTLNTAIAINGGAATNYTTGHLIVDGGTVNAGTGGLRASRYANGHGVLTLRNGNVNLASSTQSACIVGAFSGGANQRGTYEIFGGEFDLGSGNPLLFFGAAPPNNSTAILYQTNGIIHAVDGINFGVAAGPNPTGTSAMLTNSGGFLYVGANGITLGAFNANTNIISLSGGTVGALANWSSSMPMILDGNAGNITFQCADDFANPFNISLSGSLTGPGGLYKTGGGTLTLSGANNYAGTTVISNGVLAIITTPVTKINGAVTLDGSSGAPVLAVTNTVAGQKWQIGTLTFASGSPAIAIGYGSQNPSSLVAPIQIQGDLDFTVTPTFTVGGSAIPAGTFPLIAYTGTLSGTPPVSVNLPGYCSGTLVNDTANKTIKLVISSSTVKLPDSWAVGNGVWDINTTANWQNNFVSSTYKEGDSVIFDDSATGPSPITVTLNTTVNPASVTANNLTNSYTITGTGSIAGPTSVGVSGGGVLTLATANSYSGGTTVSGGSQLNVDNSSAIGTGTLALGSGAVLDNTTTSNITLQASIPEAWAGGSPAFTYLGSSNSLNTGNGAITMNANSTVVVASNTLAIGGSISDGGNNFKLTKDGSGTLALLTGNNFSGGFALNGGEVDLGDGNALGSGIFNVADGTSIDNVSGGDLTLNISEFQINGSGNNMLTFLCSSGSIDFGSAATVQQNGNANSFTFNIVTNTVTFENDLVTGNVLITKTGQGVLNIDGFASTANNMSLTANEGEVDLGRLVGLSVSALTVQSNALARITGSSGDQINNSSRVTLNTGGTLDINGVTEQINNLVESNGVVENSAGGTLGVLNILTNSGPVVIDNLTLTGTNCVFNVPPVDASLTVNAIITGSGSLAETGLGTLVLPNDNTYTGNTTIAEGILALAGSISNSAVISIHTNAILDVTGRPDQTLTLNSSQFLKGNGTVNGNLVALPGSTVAPGPSSSVGTLAVAQNITLDGSLLINLDTASTPTSSQLVSSGTIAYGGTLSVTNVGPALTVGTVFHIFPSAVTTFTGFNLATTDANGLAYTWNNNIAVDGSIQVASVTTAINPLPGAIQFGLSGNTLNLSWPTNAGWILQSQTNSLSTGLSTNWVNVVGSTSVTNVSVTIDPSEGSVFYRMVHP